MKYVLYLLVCLSLLVAGCAEAAVDDTEGDGPGPAPPPSLAPAASQNENTVPAPGLKEDEVPVEVDLERVRERAERSQVAGEACCADVSAVEECCCEKVLAKYEKHLEAGDLEAAMAIDGADQYYKLCVERFADFEGKIIALQERYLQ